MKSIRQEARNVEEAIKKVLKKLNVSRDQIEVEVKQEGSNGLFGLIGNKEAIIEAKIKKSPVKIGQEFIKNVFKESTLDVEVEVIEEETNSQQVLYNLKSPDLGIVIGHRGETLDALQYLTSLVVNKEVNEYFRVLLDAEGYRKRREKTLIRLAKKLARKAVQKGRKVVLEPMPPHERRIIHIALQDDERVKSYSEGQEPFRKVMIEVISNK